ncbi:BglG family transcription antiterminator [Companilactobacillus sp.]|jgi:mannitol operon transcriptional antiterminator|uniref:BglG family transcription antiterminator n=1 Tax=Companilactobacillus sp. TaxID=2767905 RepID=UPI0025C522FC|nr:BglG family transcription antiterminator [Companilactobacillus sp.]MCH4008728.1 BglG family transcription antiterminator [Companilactobacillus sp.]MCH4051093.1 BglG family transcription antiterminator [Companilactobacillus sp.]MCH4076671.1 BglG family transcription antiterminator [Companilactobacillus sp.]MCH4125246.1 BglG family transcription antiterminator [Companilactobacillus sp.]MCH4131786.1 BglG family transcription antiterminator [Companilactobacillus sp.]
MDLSNRESEITLLLLRNPQGLNVSDLTKGINVSKRTIYRELSSLETMLARLAIQLTKTDGLYHLVGNKDSFTELRNVLTQSDTQTILTSVATRQSAIVCKLLTVDTIITIQSLADEFEVSSTTITQDLKTIEPIFNDYELQLVRIKAKGIRVDGKESNVRRVLSGILSSEINEYEFFEFVDHLDGTETVAKNSSQYFINLLDFHLLKQASLAMEKHVKNDFTSLSDSQLKQLMIILTVSAARIRMGKLVSEFKAVDKSSIFQYQRIAIDLYNDFDQDVRDPITLMELEFMAQQIQGMSFSISKNILQDDYDLTLSYQVRSLIEEVSNDFDYDFQTDETLFNDLMAHIGSALKRRVSQLPEINNPVLQNVIENYPELYDQIIKALDSVFNGRLPKSEAAYILIHFASSFEQQRQNKPISALVVCANGIGTAKVLESRLKKTIPEINRYKVSRVAELNHLDLKDYDIILSTIFLPGFKLPYKVISPLLLNNEIEEIKTFLNERFGVVEVHPNKKLVVDSNDAIAELNGLNNKVTVAHQLLNQVEVKQIDNRAFNLQQTLLLLSRRLRPEYVTNPDMVATALYQRMEKAPVGLPNTNLALIHTTNDGVRKPFFALYDLTNPILIKGMDYKSMNLTRCLFMIAPKDLPQFSIDLLGSISSSIIDNELNLKTYQDGDSDEIKQLIAKLFLRVIKEEDWK